jgi:ABC-type multidrug transport system fused ATPase/permease subunit
MKVAQAFISAIHLLVFLLVLMFGLFFVFLYFNFDTVHYYMNYAINNPDILLKLGSVTLALALILFVSFYYLNKAQYLKISMKNNTSEINTRLIRSYIEAYFEENFDDIKHKIEVNVINNDKLHIIALVDSLDDKKEFLLNIEEKIGKLLLDHLNYDKEFIFTLKQN